MSEVRVIEPDRRPRFAWWEDAVDLANYRARVIGRRHRVIADRRPWYRHKPWVVEEADL